MSTLLDELKRRKVFRVSVMYCVVGWLLIQIGDTTFEPIGMPEGSLRYLIIVVLAGFPFAIALGWVFDWTSEGIVRSTKDGTSAANSTGRKSRDRNFPLVLGVLGSVLMLALSYAGYRGYDFYSKVQWAQNEAQPQLTELIESGDFFAAFELATQIEQALGESPAMEPVWSLISAPVSISTEPSDAIVSVRPYNQVDAPWVSLGITPIESIQVPKGNTLWKIEKEGYATRVIARSPITPGAGFSNQLNLVLDKDDPSLGSLVAVDGRNYLDAPLAGLSPLQGFDVKRFYIDRTEVTNSQYQEFVDAGGYQNEEFWLEPFVSAQDEILTFEEAISRFVDSTGRAGPSTWIGGRYPEGQAHYPVAGVSWFEAAAYAQFRGRHLPTIYHWAVAALPDTEILGSLAADLAAQSNLESSGAMPVGSTTGLSAMGALDMFGNVSEWVWNAFGGNERYTLGLGWSDPEYNAAVASAASPWSRQPQQGFRLATFGNGAPESALAEKRKSTKVVFDDVAVVSDDVYELFAARYAKSLSNIQATEQSVDLPNGYSAIRVEIDYPYSKDKLPLYLLIPENAKPPYQTLVWFGGMNALFSQDNQSLFDADMPNTNFIRQSGRLLVMPIWDGTFERNNGSSMQKFRNSDVGDLFDGWMRDLTYTLDYLESRDDVDLERIGYLGLSLGSNMGAYFLHHQTRIKTAILWSGGSIFANQENAITFKSVLARTKIPILMINGKHDYVISLEDQRVFFDLIGSPEENKKHVVFDAGHLDWPLGPFVKENLDWLDTYFGPVER